MPQILDTYDGLTCYAVTSLRDIDLSMIQALLANATHSNGYNYPRLALDESFLHSVMAGKEWVSLLVYTAKGQLIGFEHAMQRTLYCQQQPLTAYYNALFTVAPEYRRRGIARWILHCINPLLFEERQADVVFAAFQPQSAGLATSQRTHEPMPDWSMCAFHTGSIWGRRLDRALLSSPTTPLKATRIARREASEYFTPVFSEGESVSGYLPSVATLTEDLYMNFSVAFGFDTSFQRRYLDHDTTLAGTFWFDFGQGTQCAVCFDMVALLHNERRLGLLGRVQGVYGRACAPVHLYQALEYLCGYFHQQGCFFAGVLDQGVIPQGVLKRLGFRLTGDKRIFVVRGGQVAVKAFESVHLRYFIDLI